MQREYRRFKARAVTLQSRKDFRDSCERISVLWNERYPQYGVHSSERFVETFTANRATCVAVPESLQDAIQRVAYPADHHTLDERLASSQASDNANRVLNEWVALVEMACNQFWPEKAYPRPYPWYHPAQFFMSLCIIRDPTVVSADHILSPSLRLQAVPCDPRDMDSAISSVYGWLERHRQAGGASADEIEQCLRQLTDTLRLPDHPETKAIGDRLPFWTDSDSYRAAMARSITGDGFRYVAIPEGTTSNDWRKAESLAAWLHGGPEESLPERVRGMAEAGESKASIARTLGVSRRTVDRYLS
ncbi:hypothetical protein BH23CHL5_BH23CHL5_28380 [soil metagenome]